MSSHPLQGGGDLGTSLLPFPVNSFILHLLLASGPTAVQVWDSTNFLFSTTLRVYNVCMLQVWRGMQGSMEIRGASALAFQAVSLVVHHSVCQTSCLISFRGFSCLYFSSYHCCIWHYMGSPVPIITAWNLQSPGAVPPCSFSLVDFPAALAASCCHVESLPCPLDRPILRPSHHNVHLL